MIIVGITGAIGHGKTTLADALVKHEPGAKHLESFFLVAEVIDAWHKQLGTPPTPGDYKAVNAWLSKLPPIIKKSTGVSTSVSKLKISASGVAKDPLSYQKLFQHLDTLQANPKLAKDKITDANKSAYRPILQWVGGYLVEKFGSGVWWDEMVRRAQQAGNAGSKLVVVGGVRYPDDAAIVQAAGGKIIEIQRPDVGFVDAQDPTERHRRQIKADSVLQNSGNLKDLDACAQQIVKDLNNSKLKPRYTAR